MHLFIEDPIIFWTLNKNVESSSCISIVHRPHSFFPNAKFYRACFCEVRILLEKYARLKSHHFVNANLSSDKALNIQGQYGYCFQYRAEIEYLVLGSITLREFEGRNKDLKRPQKNEKNPVIRRLFFGLFNFSAFFCELRVLLHIIRKT